MIDRKNLVSRHNPENIKIDTLAPFSVGNGEFAFTVDVTGLQTFHKQYEEGMPLGTMSNWGWHTSPNPEGYTIEKFELTNCESHGRMVGYPYFPSPANPPLDAVWLRENPHRLHLGMVMFKFKAPSGEVFSADKLEGIHQSLDLWSGVIASEYSIFGERVRVETCCHPLRDMIAVRVESELLKKGNIEIALDFPYGSPKKSAAEWSKSLDHKTILIKEEDSSAEFERILDNDRYYVSAAWTPESKMMKEDLHYFVVKPSEMSNLMEFQCLFSPVPVRDKLDSFNDTREASAKYWKQFWSAGGAVELADSKDLRARELERRIILSQYLTGIQSGGTYPPQESGLVHNSWGGKFHLEMHWCHAVHFALWGRPQMLEKSMAWYESIMDKAKQTAKSQGYQGARWPKCVAPDGVNAPCYIEPFLIWQQPHPIYFADILYKAYGEESHILGKYKGLVFETAEFMASFAEWEEDRQRYVLGPPVAPAQELFDHSVTCNPAFELSYWAYGLKTAQEWRERLNLPRRKEWDHVIEHLSPLPKANGVYIAAETAPDTFADKKYTADHPTMLAPLGVLPGLMTDVEIMRKTFHKVLAVWNWHRTWGWDFPMMAMTAARLGECEKAIEMLLMDTQKNTYLINGHCFQSNELPVYLPGNGALLAAVAMMAAGWNGSPEVHAPGFPRNGKWVVQFEGLLKMP
jgi:protein-glucosylgalactosylhydroxylysine glucosidase